MWSPDGTFLAFTQWFEITSDTSKLHVTGHFSDSI